jgi:hypothetical protein
MFFVALQIFHTVLPAHSTVFDQAAELGPARSSA